MKNIISEMKNTVEGIKSRLDEAEDQIRVGRQSRKKHQSEQQLKKGTKRMKII